MNYYQIVFKYIDFVLKWDISVQGIEKVSKYGVNLINKFQ